MASDDMKPAKGAMDFYPEDKRKFNYIRDAFVKTAESFNFKEVETPAFEMMEILTKKSGEEIKKQIFTLEKKGNESLGLRFDLTIPFTRMYISKQKTLPKPVRWYSCSRMWRYEAPQKGRMREFYQFSYEIYGSDQPIADAEVVLLAINAIENLGLKQKDFFVSINNRKLLQGILESLVDKNKIEDAIRAIDKKEKISDIEFRKELLFMPDEAFEELNRLLSLPFEKLEKEKLSKLAKEGYNELKQVLMLLPKCARFDLSIARGLAYYTGTVFEIFDVDRKYRALAGGGRYDSLIEKYGGEKDYVTGAAVGFSTVQLLLEDNKLMNINESGPEYYISPLTDKAYNLALSIAKKLRSRTSVEVDLMARKLSKQLQYANTKKAKNIILIGEDELKNNNVTVKDLSTGKQKKIDINKIV